MQCVASRARYGVDYAARGLSILGRVVCRQHGKLLNGIDAKLRAKHIPWRIVGVVIEANAVLPVIVLCGPRSRDAKLRTKSARHFGGIAGSVGTD